MQRRYKSRTATAVAARRFDIFFFVMASFCCACIGQLLAALAAALPLVGDSASPPNRTGYAAAPLREAARELPSGLQSSDAEADDSSADAPQPPESPGQRATIEEVLEKTKQQKPGVDIFDRMLLKSGLNKAKRKQDEARMRIEEELEVLSSKGALFTAESQRLVAGSERNALGMEIPRQWQRHVNAETLLTNKSLLRLSATP